MSALKEKYLESALDSLRNRLYILFAFDMDVVKFPLQLGHVWHEVPHVSLHSK